MANINDFFNLQGGGLGTPAATVVSDDFTAVAAQNGGLLYLCDCAAAGQSIVVAMPASPELGDMVFVGDYDAACSVNTPIVMTSAEKIHGSDDNLIISASNVSLVFQYIDEIVGWKIIDGIGEENAPPAYSSKLMLEGSLSADMAAVDWSASGYKLSDFDEIVFSLNATMYLLGQVHCEVRIRPELLLNATNPVLLFQHTEPGTGTSYTLVALSGIGETAATLRQYQSVYSTELVEIRGITYSK